MRRIIVVVVAVLALGVAALVLTYEVFGVDVPSFMEDQPSKHYQEPPRRLPPDGAVPLSRPAYLDEPQALANPVPSDEISLQRGQLLYGFHCSVCHGREGRGDGPVVEFWGEDARLPADLTQARFRQYPDATLYRIITQGLGAMPPLRENLTERQRWDVFHAVHALGP
jgi:mono/diheme cytochrome c family protein